MGLFQLKINLNESKVSIKMKLFKKRKQEIKLGTKPVKRTPIKAQKFCSLTFCLTLPDSFKPGGSFAVL